MTVGNSITSIGSNFNSNPNLTDVYCYAENVPDAKSAFLYSSNKENATLHVPSAAVSLYKRAWPWSGFKSVVALTDNDPKPTNVKDVTMKTDVNKSAIYDINGHRWEYPKKGLYIVDGKKVLVK